MSPSAHNMRTILEHVIPKHEYGDGIQGSTVPIFVINCSPSCDRLGRSASKISFGVPERDPKLINAGAF